MYDKATTADLVNSLGGYAGTNVMEQLEKLDSGLYENFVNELEESLKGWDYDSKTVVKESLEKAAKDFFSDMNYQIKRGIENEYQRNGREAALEKYFEKTDSYKTANYETIEKYVDFVEALDKIEFFF